MAPIPQARPPNSHRNRANGGASIHHPSAPATITSPASPTTASRSQAEVRPTGGLCAGPEGGRTSAWLRRRRTSAWLRFAVSARYLARSRYTPSRGFTRTRSPSPMNSGTWIVTPLLSLAGLVLAVLVAVFMIGAVSTTSSSATAGS